MNLLFQTTFLSPWSAVDAILFLFSSLHSAPLPVPGRHTLTSFASTTVRQSSALSKRNVKTAGKAFESLDCSCHKYSPLEFISRKINSLTVWLHFPTLLWNEGSLFEQTNHKSTKYSATLMFQKRLPIAKRYNLLSKCLSIASYLLYICFLFQETFALCTDKY